jgi:hypothetical protein
MIRAATATVRYRTSCADDDDSVTRRGRNRAEARRTPGLRPGLSAPPSTGAGCARPAPAPAPEASQATPQTGLRGRFTDPVTLAAYVGAGRGTVTVLSTRTGTRFTFRFRVPKDRAGRPGNRRPVWVSVLTGPDNEVSYNFVGTLWIEPGTRSEFRPSPKSPLSYTAPAARAARWFAAHVIDAPARILEAAEVWHEGRCGRCGRTLTVPESIDSGFGPECGGRR